MKWLDDISYVFLIAAALLMAMMPFQPEPHLVQKYGLWLTGNLQKPADIFDVFWHLLPTLLLLLKFVRAIRRK